MITQNQKFVSQIRTNFIMPDEGLPGSCLTYRYEDGYSFEFIGCRILIYAFLDFETNYCAIAKITFEELFHLCGLKGDSKRFRTFNIYPVILDCLQWFIDNNYITIINDKPLDEFYFKETIKIKISENFLPLMGARHNERTGEMKNVTLEPYVAISYDELNTITNMNTSAQPSLMAIYVYIKARCGGRRKDQTAKERPVCMWESYQTISEKTGSKRGSTLKYIEKLCTVGLIKRKAFFRTYDRKAPYVYTWNQKGWEEELHYGALRCGETYKTRYNKPTKSSSQKGEPN